jgi:hypothetical protein
MPDSVRLTSLLQGFSGRYGRGADVPELYRDFTKNSNK